MKLNLETTNMLTEAFVFLMLVFNKDRTEAFVQVDFVCLALCGRGDSVLLERNNNVWEVKEVSSRWKS